MRHFFVPLLRYEFCGGFLPLQFDDSAAEPNRYGLRPVTCPQLFHDVFDVNLDRFFGNEKLFRDVAIPVSPGNLPEYFDLTNRQVFVAEMFSQPAASCMGMRFFPAWTWRIVSTSSLGGMLLSM